jgi:hypothetical protein
MDRQKGLNPQKFDQINRRKEMVEAGSDNEERI